MFFTTVEDEAALSGMRIESIFSNVVRNIQALFNKNATINMGDGFTASLESDRVALENYLSLLSQGVNSEEAFAMTMREASIAAQEYANSINTVGLSTEQCQAKTDAFVASQNMSQVASLAQNKSLTNVRTILNEYNSGMATCGLTQQQFTQSVGQSNSILGGYLAQVGAGNATMRGYIGSLVAAKVASIGLRIATTALNAVIGMGIGLIVSLLSSGIMALIENAKDNLKPLSEKLDDVNNRLKETETSIKDIASAYKEVKKSSDEVIPRFVKLAKGVDSFGKNVSLTDDEYNEFLELNNKIADMFPELNMGMDENGNAMLNLSYSADTLKESLLALVEAQRQQANTELADKLPDLVGDINNKTQLLKQEIDGHKAQIERYKSLLNGTYTESNFGSDMYYDELIDKGINIKREATGSGKGYMGYEYTNYRYYIDEDDEATKRVINDYIAGLNKQIESAESKIKNSWQSASASLQAWLQTNSTFESFGASLQKVANTMLQNVDWSELGLETDEEITGYIETNILEPLSQADLKTQAAFDDLIKIEPNQFNSVSEYMGAIKDKIKEIADMSDIDGLDYDTIFSSLGYDEIFKKYNDAIDGIKGLLPDVSDDMIESLAPEEIIEAFDYIKTYGIQSWDDLQTFIEAKRFSESFNIEDIEDLKDELDNLKDAFDDISDIVEDYNENGYYSLDNLKSLLELEPEYLNALIDENGQINLNSQAYKDYVEAKAKLLVVDQIKSLYETILGMGIEEAQAYANAEAYNTEAESLQDLISATTSYYLVLAKAKDAQNNTTAYTDGMKQSFKTVANYAAIYDSWLNSLNSSTNEFTNQTNSAKPALEAEKDALESQKDALEDYKDSLEDAKDALEDYKDSLETAQDDLQSLIDLVIDYIKQTKENEKSAIQDSIDALNDKKSALDDQKDAYSDLIAKRKEEIEALYEEKKAQDELSEKQKSAAKDALALAVAQLDDSSAGKKAQKQAQDNYAASNKDLKDYLDDQAKDKRIAALEEEEKAYEEMIERRKAAIDAQVEHLESKIDEIDAYLDNSRKMYEDACAMIDNDNGTLYANLWNYTYQYTTKTRAEFDNLWSNAQAAIQRYKGDNDTLIGTMETLQQKIYDTDGEIADLNTQIDDCETQIGYLDTAISNTSDAISATSDSIDSVSSSLDGLGGSIADYMAQLAELSAAANNIDVTPNANGDKTKFWVTHNGKRYETGYNYNGDTPGNRILAAAELTKLIAKDVSGFDQYGLGIVQGYLGVGTNPTHYWYLDYNGKRLISYRGSKSAAVKDIMEQIGTSDPRAGSAIATSIKHYATGTRNSDSVAITQENGFEAIFGKLSRGQYTLMPQGSQVFTAAQTDNLYGFASNPQKFMNDIIGKTSSFLSSRYGGYREGIGNVTNKVTKNGGDITMHFAPVTTIQGNADRDTINQMDKLYEKFKERFMLEILRENNNL